MIWSPCLPRWASAVRPSSSSVTALPGALVAFVRRRLCVTADHDAEIDAWMGDPPSLGLDNMATLWWDV
jgi:hypothetical protein